MKFLVTLCGLLAVASAAPTTNDYEVPAAPVVVAVPIPAAPVQDLNIPAIAPVAPALAPRVIVNHAPFVPAPVQLAHQPIVQVVQQPTVVRTVAPASPLAVAAAPAPLAVAAAPAPIVAPVATVNSQFHAQDELGGVNFGYQNDLSSRQEIRTPDGVTRGAYSYVDANGIVQQVEYIADPINGFRVAATNLPVVDNTGAAVVAPLAAPVAVEVTPEVKAATEAHLKAVAEAKAAATVERKKRSSDYQVPAAPVVVAPPAPVVVPAPVAPALVQRTVTVAAHQPIVIPQPFAQPITVPAQSQVVRVASPAHIAVPAPVAAPVALPAPISTPLAAAPAPIATPVAVAAPVATVNSQFHAQDELGGVNFGYQNENSARQEIRTPDGVTRGAYSYVDANGIVQRVEYVADPVNGFRVAATNLPVVDNTGAAVVATPLAAPVAVGLTPEVQAATAEHLAAVEAAKAAALAA